jgi:RNA polymerase sigma factor (sigma-70 family)
MDRQQLIPHLFRTEFRRITSVLCKTFGLSHLEAAEDIASETFLTALQVWPYDGIPENPTAWLYAVAKRKALNHVARTRTFADKVSVQWKNDYALEQPSFDLSEKSISDSQLQMMFAICHPAIPIESQIALSLRILCGFGIDELANAFLSNRETVIKRLSRAREKLKTVKMDPELPEPKDIGTRLDAVLTTLYLLFNEGYYSESKDSILREDLCLEAIRLTHLLTGHENTNHSRVKALLALMCFHSSRFPARKDEHGEIILYGDQNPALWNQELISMGCSYLHEASTGNSLSRFHIEATIAYWHTVREDSIEKWENILQMYNRLIQLEYSPIAALNRTYALSKARGKQLAIAQAEKLQMNDNHYFLVLMGELYSGFRNDKSIEYFRKAEQLAKSKMEKQILKRKIERMQEKNENPES